MKKKVLLTILCLIFLLSMVACNTTQEEREYSNISVEEDEEVIVKNDVEQESEVSENKISENRTDEKVSEPEIESVNETEKLVVIENLYEHVNNDIDGYKKAIFWITNPNAGRVYWGNTKGEYEQYISSECVEEEIKKRDNIDLLAYGVEDEIEYAMKYMYEYDKLKGVDYEEEYDGYSKITEAESMETIPYDEMLKNVENLGEYGFTEYYTSYKYVNGEPDYTQIDLLSAPHVWGETYITREEMLASIRPALENPSELYMNETEIDVVSNKVILTLGNTIKYVCSTNEYGQITHIEIYNISTGSKITAETEGETDQTDPYREKFDITDELYNKFDLRNRAVYLIEEGNDTTLFTCLGYKDDGLLFTAYNFVYDYNYDMLISFTNDNKIEYCNRDDEIFNQYTVY